MAIAHAIAFIIARRHPGGLPAEPYPAGSKAKSQQAAKPGRRAN
jgi:hypothetical protein